MKYQQRYRDQVDWTKILNSGYIFQQSAGSKPYD